MPLVRFQLRNEYGLGQSELYKEVNKEDPKAVLDGVAVAGLVGILRQLGDLAEFAAEVFHGLQEQVMTTASRSHKLKVRVRNIEAALPPLEKAVLAQTSHIHFAYTAGCEWHPRIKYERNHFVYKDLPQFIMGSYEECRDPPRLHVLDKFDTGGPGSCLKRYSDPTFFKRVSVNIDEQFPEKVQRVRKTRRSKKKKSFRKNEALLGEPISHSGGRMQFTSPIVRGRTSPSQTGSTVDMTVRSDLGDHSNSFDSGAGAGYIDCIFHPSDAMQPDKEESKESSSFRLSLQNDTLPSVFPVVEDDHSPNNSPEQKIAFKSSCVTWDEKEEIVEPNCQQFNGDEAPVMLATTSDLDALEGRAFTLTDIDHIHMPFVDENKVKSFSSGVQANEIESEPDDYMDALNSIELESENDLGCQTKREVELFSSHANDEIIENEVIELSPNISEPDHHLCSFGSHTASKMSLNQEVSMSSPESVHELPPHRSEQDIPTFGSNTANDISLNKEVSPNLPDLQASKTSVHEELLHITENSTSDGSVDTICSHGDVIPNCSALDSVNADIPASGTKTDDLPDMSGDRINSNNCESKDFPAEVAGSHSVRLWTNGGLLGLEPSKPPDFTMSIAVSQGSLTRMDAESGGASCSNFMLKSNGCKETLGISTKIAESIQKDTSLQDDQHNSISNKKASSGFLPADRDSKIENSCSFHLSNGISKSNGDGLNETRVKTSGCAVPVAPDVSAASTECSQGNNENSSLVFGLSHKLLMNSFRRRLSLDEKSGPASSVQTEVLEKEQDSFRYQSISQRTFKGQFGYGSIVDTLPSSPPLELMKISFHPINGFEDSKLKLKFPDGSNSHESIRDTFPSFQLVPEPTIPVHDSGSNSDDDDTFCRSSTYMSDEYLSHHSDSDSEHWESDVTPEKRDHGEFDSFCRVSSSELISRSQEIRRATNIDMGVDNEHGIYTENGVGPLSRSLLDFPSFDAVNSVQKQENKDNLDPNDLVKLQSTAKATPLPPPLPPLQWRVSNPLLDMTDDMHYISEATGYSYNMELSESTFSQQTRPAATMEKQSHDSHEAIARELKNKLDLQKLNERKEAIQMANGEGMDEREDFLQQIRRRSFNLRRTATEKTNVTAGSSTNVNVTAILEKANAIRQAVASEDGEDDDNWSDT
ncbi:protein SCAR3-like isoform X2 [Quillaja saponaria]|uniref:Protein SCAR n=1 Tax=Quillaja saponaria TaxID=32244 RepID=A0AAD7M2E4_QUISA|nr:protein SCAR3-like isoform X2 [Quillaja saponaria]